MSGPTPPPNVFDPRFDEPREHPGFAARRARVGRQAGCRRLGASVWELGAGQAAYPYHAHLGEEELIIVLSGSPSLRTPAGWRELVAGDVVAFARGEEGAHQLANRTSETVRFVALSTNDEPDIVLYPDAGRSASTSAVPTGPASPPTSSLRTRWTTGRASRADARGRPRRGRDRGAQLARNARSAGCLIP
jgi:uncharacterized cupin superfamily protein